MATNEKLMNGEERFREMQGDVAGMAGAAREKGEKLINKASSAMCDFSTQVCDGVSDAKSKVGDKMASLAGTIRENAPSGSFGSAASSVADKLETSGEYIARRDFAQMGEDVTSVVKKYPKQSLLAGIGFGFLLANFIRSAKR